MSSILLCTWERMLSASPVLMHTRSLFTIKATKKIIHIDHITSWNPSTFSFCKESFEYLWIGGVIFHYTECPEELENAKRLWEDERELALDLLMLKEELHNNYSHVMESVLQRVINKDFNYLDETTNKTVCRKWNYENSLFFAFTVVTTIGK